MITYDIIVFSNDALLRVFRKCVVHSVNVLLVPRRLKADFTVGDGEGSDSSWSSNVGSVESQFDSSNMSTCWDRKTDLVLLLEVWLGNGLSVLGVAGVGTLVILIMSSCLNLLKS